MPFTKDGAGEICFQASCIGSPINSWNLEKLVINGVDFTNKWADASTLPAAASDGKYYIYYKSSVSYGHFEATGSCSGGSTNPPSSTTAPTNPPTDTIAPTVVPGDTAAPTATPGPTAVPTATPAQVDTPAPTNPPADTQAPTTAPAETPAGGGSVSCAGKPVWNSQITYNTSGQLVEYNCKLYQNQGFAYNLNPETNNGQYYPWLLVGTCSESNCAMGEGPFIGCGQWDKYVLGTWTVYNNIWGGADGSQCLTAYSISNWSVVSTQPATSGVKTYPNTGIVNVNKSIGSIGSFTSSFNVTVPSSGDWEVAYDIWIPSEVMLWMYTVGNVGPIAEGWNDDGTPIPSATNVSVGGHTWNVYHGGSNVVSFLRVGGNISSGTVDIKAILNWIVSKGWASSSGVVGASQFGFEISGTGNQPLTFKCNSFSMTVN
jgi:hypothetical protein